MASRSQKVDNTPLNDWNSSFEDRTSLLARLEESNRAIKKKFPLHRLVVIGRLPEHLADRRDLGVHYEELNQRLQRYYQGDGITGLLLLYPTCMLHVVESSCEVLVSLLQDLRDMQQQPHWLFQQWSSKVLNVEARTLDDGSEEDTETLVGTALSLLMKLGSHHQKANKGSKTQTPGSVLDEVPELIVPQDVLAQLLRREELLTPQQYLNAYYSPLNILMDSECVWPSPKHLGCV